MVNGKEVEWSAFDKELVAKIEEYKKEGKKIELITGDISSPSTMILALLVSNSVPLTIMLPCPDTDPWLVMPLPPIPPPPHPQAMSSKAKISVSTKLSRTEVFISSVPV